MAQRGSKLDASLEAGVETGLGDLPACPVETTLMLISNRWMVLILRDLLTGTKRYGELSRSLKHISPKVLVSNLQKLEQNGLVRREVFPEVPPRVEYTLTDTGKSLKGVLDVLGQWGIAYQKAYQAANGDPLKIQSFTLEEQEPFDCAMIPQLAAAAQAKAEAEARANGQNAATATDADAAPDQEYSDADVNVEIAAASSDDAALDVPADKHKAAIDLETESEDEAMPEFAPDSRVLADSYYQRMGAATTSRAFDSDNSLSQVQSRANLSAMRSSNGSSSENVSKTRFSRPAYINNNNRRPATTSLRGRLRSAATLRDLTH